MYLSLYQFIHLIIYLSLYFSICLSINLSIYILGERGEGQPKGGVLQGGDKENDRKAEASGNKVRVR